MACQPVYLGEANGGSMGVLGPERRLGDLGLCGVGWLYLRQFQLLFGVGQGVPFFEQGDNLLSAFL